MSDNGDVPEGNDPDTSASTTNPNATVSGSGDTNISDSLTFDTLSGSDDSQNLADKLEKPNQTDDSIFSRNNTYEDKYILTENMVNNYTFSEESKSSDCKTDSSADEDKSASLATRGDIAETSALDTKNTENLQKELVKTDLIEVDTKTDIINPLDDEKCQINEQTNNDKTESVAFGEASGNDQAKNETAQPNNSDESEDKDEEKAVKDPTFLIVDSLDKEIDEDNLLDSSSETMENLIFEESVNDEELVTHMPEKDIRDLNLEASEVQGGNTQDNPKDKSKSSEIGLQEDKPFNDQAKQAGSKGKMDIDRILPDSNLENVGLNIGTAANTKNAEGTSKNIQNANSQMNPVEITHVLPEPTQEVSKDKSQSPQIGSKEGKLLNDQVKQVESQDKMDVDLILRDSNLENACLNIGKAKNTENADETSKNIQSTNHQINPVEITQVLPETTQEVPKDKSQSPEIGLQEDEPLNDQVKPAESKDKMDVDLILPDSNLENATLNIGKAANTENAEEISKNIQNTNYKMNSVELTQDLPETIPDDKEQKIYVADNFNDVDKNGSVHIEIAKTVDKTSGTQIKPIDTEITTISTDVSNDGSDKIEFVMSTDNTKTEDQISIVEDADPLMSEAASSLSGKSREETLMDLDASDEVPLMDDNLGLLAEARILHRDDDDEEEEYDDDDDDDEPDDDESSNQNAPDSSEVDSNAANNEEHPEESEFDHIDQSEDDTDLIQAIHGTDDSNDAAQKIDGGIDASNDAIDAVDESSDSVTETIDGIEQSHGTKNDIEQVLSPKLPKEIVNSVESAFGTGFKISIITGSEEKKARTREINDNDENEPDTVLEPVRVNKTSERVPQLAVTPAVDTTEEAMDVDISAEATAAVETHEEGKSEDVEKDAGIKADIPKIDQAPPPADATPNKPLETALTPSKETSKRTPEDSPSKTKRLEIAKLGKVMNIVDLEESSSSDSDVQEVNKELKEPPKPGSPAVSAQTTTVNIPKGIDIMSASNGDSSTITSTQDESVISGLPKPSPTKTAPRINTSEITIKTAPKEQETTTNVSDEEKKEQPKSPNFNLEVFNVDSDDDDCRIDERLIPRKKLSAIELDKKARERKKCVNYMCESDPNTAEYTTAPAFLLSFYEVKRSKRNEQLVCAPCLQNVSIRMSELVEGVRARKPLSSLDMFKQSQDFVEISDSESESDGEDVDSGYAEKLTPDSIKFLEENLGEMINKVWTKYGLHDQLKSCEDELKKQLEKIEEDSKEVEALLNACQDTTDKIRNEFYQTFASGIKELPPLEIFDAPYSELTRDSYRDENASSDTSDSDSRRSKRPRKSVNYEERSLSGRSPIPLGYSHINSPTAVTTSPPSQMKPGGTDSPVIVEDKSTPRAIPPADDNADVSVVHQTLESAPADLPAPGELYRPQLKVGDMVYAMRSSTFGSWGIARVQEVMPRGNMLSNGTPLAFTNCKVRFEARLKGPAVKMLNGRQLAYTTPAPCRLTIGVRVIAVFKDPTNLLKRESYFSGIIAELPNPVNNYRYLVFFDDGYAQYVTHSSTLVICESSSRVWDDVHPDSREFVRKYLLTYPERPMVRLQPGQALKTEWNGKWWVSRVVKVDASLVQVTFDVDGRVEWIYRGSTRLAPLFLELQAAERHRPRGLTRLNKQAPAVGGNIPYVEYTRSDEQQEKVPESVQQPVLSQNYNILAAEDTRRQQHQQQRAKKSSSAPQAPLPIQPLPQPASQQIDNVMSRVVYYSPKAAVKPHKMTTHSCGIDCRRSDVFPLKELTKYNPLARPLLSGWERQVLRYRGKKVVMYRTPCGRRVRDMEELHRYLRITHSEMGVDLFDFNPITHCLAEFVLNKCYVSKKDLSLGKENMAVPCVNYYDGSLPEFCLYMTERTPTEGVPLNLDPEFLCGCDCTDDCQDRTKCACWKMTLDGAKTIGLEGPEVGYQYRRLQEQLPTGIYECNSRCKCAKTCLNRVAQHPLQLKLQVFKTLNRGWGIRALNDVPKGGFLCVYAGNLLTDATANLDGINEGDEYLAELDYIEVVERMKEGYESDVPDEDKEGDKKSDKTDEEEEPSEDEGRDEAEADADFKPEAFISQQPQFSKRLRRRGDNNDKDKKDGAPADKEKSKEPSAEQDDSFITISDDEEVREPSRFTAQTGLEEDDYVPRHRSVRSFYGRDEACYIMDAKVRGNIGRYLNHSCQPNVFVQNVFVDTHDPRFPWVAFFALSHIKAGTELTWNYNYDIGSVPDKVMYCKCGAPNCRGRLL